MMHCQTIENNDHPSNSPIRSEGDTPPFSIAYGAGAHQLVVPKRPIRVTVVHPSLAKYRVPVFRELARRPGIKLRVVYGSSRDIPNVAAAGFEAIATRRWEGRLGGRLVMFHGAEWTYCSRRHSDVVVLRWSPRSLSLLPALLRARLNGVPTVLWGHGYSKTERTWWRSARNQLAKLASALVFYEPRTREAFIREGWNPDRLFVALNSLDHAGIDHERKWWLDHPEKLAEFRQQQGLGPGAVVLFVSRLQPNNGLDLLIRATAQLARELTGITTVIIGNGPEEKRRLQKLAVETGAANNVMFREGTYDEQELAPWFLSADVFCYPVNVGLSLLHSFWYGLPAVTSGDRASQNPEIVALQHGINGLTYEHNNMESLMEALKQLLTNRDLQHQMSEAARRTVENKFTIPNMVDGLEAAICNAVVTAERK